ncbi:MAG: hypothetical protein HQL51_07340 [Magnetococcales bacterium]|nr:hypothetical protein [Magnetococcales bacterium]
MITKPWRKRVAALGAVVCATAVGGGEAAPAGSKSKMEQLRLCTGQEGGTYFPVGNEIKRITGKLDVVVVETQGSIENLVQMANGGCDAAIVQADALGYFEKANQGKMAPLERMDHLYDEYAHLICHKGAALEEITDMKRHPSQFAVAMEPEGSGSYLTWRVWGIHFPAYAKVEVKQVPFNEGLEMVGTGIEAQCLLYVGGINSQQMRMADEDDRLRLIPINDPVFKGIKDPFGHSAFQSTGFPEGIYGNLLALAAPKNQTVSVKAVLVINQDWIAAHNGGYQEFRTAVAKAKNGIRDVLGY